MHEGWASGVGATQRFEAPVELPGWSERAWIEVRPLTEAEALEQESLGLIEEYELVQRGLGEPELRVRRVYDLVAMAEYEWGKCVVDWWLPESLPPAPLPEQGGGARPPHPQPLSHADADVRRGRGERPEANGVSEASGTVSGGESGLLLKSRLMADDDPEGNLRFLREMGPCLAAWVREALDQVNWRLPEQRAQLEAAKKN